MSDYMQATALKVSDPSEPRILIVDDDEIIRLYLECLLTESGYQVSAASDFDTVKEALSSHAYALIIADLVFCEQAYSGLDIVKYFLSVHADSKAIIMTSYPSTHTAIASLRMQAVDYLTKPSSQKEILSAVSNALDGGKQQVPIVPSEGSTISLTRRESETLLHLFNGCSYRKIASNMGCTFLTAKTYGRRIYSKLDVNSRSEAIHKALRLGLVTS